MARQGDGAGEPREGPLGARLGDPARPRPPRGALVARRPGARGGQARRARASSLGAVRAVLVDLEGRRVLFVRASLLVVLTLAAVGAAFVVLLVAGEARRLFHDLTELAGRWAPRPADSVLAAGLLVLPLFLAARRRAGSSSGSSSSPSGTRRGT